VSAGSIPPGTVNVLSGSVSARPGIVSTKSIATSNRTEVPRPVRRRRGSAGAHGRFHAESNSAFDGCPYGIVCFTESPTAPPAGFPGLHNIACRNAGPERRDRRSFQESLLTSQRPFP
jgi:hypothetical protein